MCNIPITIVKEVIHAQNYVGNIQFVILILGEVILFAAAKSYVEQDLKCDVDRGKNDYVNALCTKHHSKEQFWSTPKKVLAVVSWILVHLTWLLYLVYVVYKTHNAQQNESLSPFQRPPVRKYYIGQAIVRSVFLGVFIILICVIPSTDFVFEEQFLCREGNILRESSNATALPQVLCLDRWNDENTVFSIVVLSFAVFLFILALIEWIYELCCFPKEHLQGDIESAINQINSETNASENKPLCSSQNNYSYSTSLC